MDLMLPGKGGYEVVRDLQATDAARVPVVVITGRTIDRKNMEMIKNEPNVRDFMQKPLRPTMLATAPHSLLQTRPRDQPRHRSGTLGRRPVLTEAMEPGAAPAPVRPPSRPFWVAPLGWAAPSPRPSSTAWPTPI